jgi:predicted nucleic acid-binding protein
MTIRIVVDTNILFSTLLNTNSRIGQILIKGHHYYNFFSPEYIRDEIFEHKYKIQHLAKMDDIKFIETYELAVHNISIISNSVIPATYYKKAEFLCSSIDIDDTPFIAATEFLRGKLWTGDKMLINGLLAKNYSQIITTEELYQDFISKIRHRK